MVNVSGLESIIERGKVELAESEAANLARQESSFAKTYRDIQLSIGEVLGTDAGVILAEGVRHISKTQTVYLKYNDLIFSDGRGWGDGSAFRLCTVDEEESYSNWHVVKDIAGFAKAIQALQQAEADEAARIARNAEREALAFNKSPFGHLVPELQQLLWDVQHAHDLTDAQKLTCAVIGVFAEWANTDMPEWDAEEDA